MLSTPDYSAAHPMLFGASYQKSGPGKARAPDGGISGNLRGQMWRSSHGPAACEFGKFIVDETEKWARPIGLPQIP
jgi:hypothetical protein